MIRPFIAIALLLPILLAAGCDSKPSSGKRGPSIQAGPQGDLFPSIAQQINSQEEYEPSQIMPQLCDRLNHWARHEKLDVDWKPDPLVEKLPEQIRKLPPLRTLESPEYSLADMVLLQEAVWFRDIAQIAKAGEDLEVATKLFDWTVRNIQLEPDSNNPPRMAGEVLLLGRGTALERAWVFMLLCRQQKLDVLMLAVPGKEGSAPKPWLTAALVDDDLYLFDPRLGLPIRKLEAEQPVTLEDAAKDESILAGHDLEEEPYPVHAADIKDVVAYIEASTAYLEKRMKWLDAKLTGQQRVVLSVDAGKLAERVGKLPHIAKVEIWPLPYEALRAKLTHDKAEVQAHAREMRLVQLDTPIGKGRVRQFKGAIDGDKGARHHLLEARPSAQMLDELREKPETVLGPAIKRVPPADRDKIIGQQIQILEQARQHASMYLGIIAFEQADYPVAIDYFSKRVIAEAPKGPMATGARYNLARSYEAAGQNDEAIKIYEADRSAQHVGNQLRAKRLKKGESPAKAE